MEAVLKERGHQLSATHLYTNQALPLLNDIDWLIVMGGPMGVYDDDLHPWLRAEKKFIRDAIDSGMIVLGICLGAQLIADALGARVYKNPDKEIGWFNIHRSEEADGSILAKEIPEQVEVFHWHGDTFDIPHGATLLAESTACKNQGFIMDERVLAFQFHLETTGESAMSLIDNCGDELDGSAYVQSKNEMLANPQRFSTINKIMRSVLGVLEENKD
ncbi:Glutamine amidotransferase, class I [hydrothermal vent metagenome]|uniref:Glutamine amidotransferase, class I n=1 Tax=hydrothermal vent metagenome TaxID=652676 RepID=A0A3B1B6R3_9ZZZZ